MPMDRYPAPVPPTNESIAKTREAIIPVRARVRDGQIVSLLDQAGNEMGLPVTATPSDQGATPDPRGIASAAARLTVGDVKLSLSEPSAAYCFFYPCNQVVGSGGPLDNSGKGNHAFLRSAWTDDASGPWVNPGYLTTAAATDKFAQASSAFSGVNFDTQSLLLSFTCKLTASATDPVGLLSWSLSSGSIKGLYFQKNGSNQLRIGVNKGSGGSTIANVAKTIADGTDHTITALIEAGTHDVFVWVDGIPSNFGFTKFTGDATFQGGYQLGIGGPPDNTLTGATGYATQLKNIHMLVFDGRSPINLPQIARRLSIQPDRPLLGSDILPPAKTVRTAVTVGQSNTQGSGETKDYAVVYGPGIYDPVPPNGTSGRSIWPRLCSRLASEADVWLRVFNSAVGNTSATTSWCGRIQNWATGMIAERGAYVLSGGGIWKSNALATGWPVSTVAPTGTADTTGADGVPWLYLGAPTAKDVPGVLAEGHPRFDPNGYLATAAGGFASMGYGEKWAFVSFGQNDSSIGLAQAEFAAAYRNITNYFRSRGVKVSLGISCYNAVSPTNDAAYLGVLIPACEQILAEFAGDGGVIRGANLRTALGVLPVTPPRGTIGLRADQVHMNDAGYKAASDEEFRSLIAAGW